MKKFWVVACVGFVLLMASPAMAQSSEARLDGWGVGLGIGTGITGVSLKNQTSGDKAFQAVIGCWGGYRNNCYGLGGSLDLLVNMPVLTQEDSVSLAWNLGGGGAVGVRGGSDWGRHPRGSGYRGNDLWLAGQFVAGLEVLFPSVPLDVVVEWRPSLWIVPGFHFQIENAGFHVRYYFQ